MLEEHRHRIDGRNRIDLVGARVFRRTAPHRLKHAHATGIGVEIAPCRDSHASLQNASQVSDDVAEHVRRHDHVIGLGILHHPHAASIDVVVVGLHIGVVLGHLLECPPPEVVAKGEHVGLRDEREGLPGTVPLPRVFEGPADAPLAALPRVDRLLHRHLVRCALLEKAAHAAVEIFRVLANHHEIDVGRPAARQRCLHAGE